MLLSVFFTYIVKFLAKKFNILDRPINTRKIHKKSTPLLGGTAIFLTFFLVLFFVKDKILIGELDPWHWLGFFIGSIFLIIGGFLDDKYNIKPKCQIIFPILAIISLIIGGVEIEKITNPLGGYLFLDNTLMNIFTFSNIMIFSWLMTLMYTTKLLDGIDGLVTGTIMIGAIIIFLFTMTTKYYQPDIGLSSFILAASCFGFLIFNWHPAKIFLGEGGSLFLGFALGVLAIISGGKIAITLLVMGIPLLDLAWTVVRRLAKRQNPFSHSDDKHIHYRLLNITKNQKKTVLIYYSLALFFGLSGLFLQSIGKMFALGLIFLIMIMILIFLSLYENKQHNN